MSGALAVAVAALVLAVLAASVYYAVSFIDSLPIPELVKSQVKVILILSLVLLSAAVVASVPLAARRPG